MQVRSVAPVVVIFGCFVVVAAVVVLVFLLLVLRSFGQRKVNAAFSVHILLFLVASHNRIPQQPETNILCNKRSCSST